MKDKLITVMFCAVIGAISLFNLITPDKALSYAERRKLIQAPNIDTEFIFSGKAQTDLEDYLLDQFVFRDTFRRVKAVTDLKVFHKKDNNGIYLAEGHVFKRDYPLKEESVLRLADKMQEIYEMYLSECKVAYAIIPDKSNYAPETAGQLRYDYYDMAGLLYSRLSTGDGDMHFKFIDLTDALTLSDYYTTDLHWKQEGLGRVLQKIGSAFGREFPAAGLPNPAGELSDSTGGEPSQGTDSKLSAEEYRAWEEAGYKVNQYEPFYGAYYGQSALSLQPDRLTYFTGSRIDWLSVDNMDSRAGEEEQVIYNTGKLGSIDSYEVFLSGNSPLVVIENPALMAAAKNGGTAGKELIVFRDSYGSSIAPFLAEGYSKVTLIDLRFVGYSHIGEFVDFQDQDVLFLYGASVANSSDMIRKQ